MTEFFVGLASGGLLVATGFLTGIGWAVVEHGKEERRRKLLEAKPICGCHHHYSFHAEGKKCHWNNRGLYEHDVCGCQRYIGPVPDLPE